MISAGGSKHSAITNCLLYFIAVDNRPFDVVKGQGFKKLLKELAPLYKIPCADTLKARMDEKFEALQGIYIDKFEHINKFCMTCDVWTETMSNRSFLGVTVHYISKTQLQLNTVNIAVSQLSERKTAEYISGELSKILSEWGINNEKICAVVTDNGSNIVAAVNNTFGKAKHIPCFAHTINLVSDSVLKHPEASAIVDKVREVVKYIKNSVTITDELRKKHIESGIPEGQFKKVILDVKTRWNSTFYMLERFVELSRSLNEILLDKPQAPPMPTALELVLIKGLMALLKPLESMTKEASGELYTTASKVIPMINCSVNRIKEINFETDSMKSIKDCLLEALEKRFGKVEHFRPLAIATVLDPRFKVIHFKDPSAVASAISCLRTNLRKNVHLQQSSSSSDSESDAQSYDFWSYHKMLAHSQKTKSNEAPSVPDEVSSFLNSPVCPLSYDPIKQWDEMKTLYPGLYQEACHYLTQVATSVPSERLFSKAGATVLQTRNRLSGKRLGKLLFLGSLQEDEWFGC